LGAGSTVSECWKEIWHVLQPLIDTPFKGGPSTWNEDILLELNRHGFTEETHFTIAYSPVPDETVAGGIGGVLATVHEITDKVIGERRIVALRDLGARAAEAKTPDEACAVAGDILASHPRDTPFALIYLMEPGGASARLAGTAGAAGGSSFAPSIIRFEAGAKWPLEEVHRKQTLVVIDKLPQAEGSELPQGPWSEPPGQVVLVPIRSNIPHQLSGFLIAGVSSRLKLDELYRGFYELVAGQIATAISNASAYEEERRRAESLAELDRAKTAFFSNVSHEFRTPLTLMLGPLEDMLQRGDAEGQLQVVHRNSLRLLRLVNTMLDFSRIEAGRSRANYRATDLAAFTADLASSFRSACERAGLTLTVVCPPLIANETAFVDREMWEKIVLNLVSNAFKFTLQGEIEVRLAAIDGKAHFTVSDTGVGIPANEIPRMFERFHRVAQTHGRTHEGTGIGLALVQELVKLQGGEVKVESILGKGSRFTVSIPLGSSHLDPKYLGTETGLGSTATGAAAFVEEALRWLPDSSHEPLLEPDSLAQQSSHADPSKSRLRVIWADDNADMRAYVARLLRNRCEVESFPDGEAALQAALQNPPDLVLSDVMMPRLDGIGLLRGLRADPRTAHCAVILISARAGEESRIEGMEAGADDYIIKPFNAAELIARVETRANMARMRRVEEERLADDLKAMERLYQLGNWCAQRGDDFDGCLDEILTTAIAITSADKGNIQLLDEETGMLRIATQRGFEAPFLKFFAEVAAGEAATCGAALQAAGRIVVPDITQSEIFAGHPALDVLLKEDLRAVQSTPLISSSGRVFGMISTHFRGPRQQHARDLHLMDLLARQTADYLERRQAEIALDHRTQQFETLINQAPLGVYLVDADFKIRSVNPVALPVFGAIPGGIVGRDFEEIIHILWQKDFADEIVRIFRHTLATGEPYVSPERIEQRKDRGITEYYEWRIDRIVLPDGRYGIVCYFRDILAQVQARETQQLLLNELNHRIKNTLASVQAIAQHTLRTTKNLDDFAASFTGRIQAMSRVHSLLSSSSWKGADLRDIIRDQLLMGAVDETRLTAWGPAVHLEPQAAQHLALMLHELGTNSAKYGALSKADGYVTVSWNVADALLHLQWVERGGPLVSTPVKRGFGTMFIEQSARGEGGDAHMLIDAQGLSWAISLPLPRHSSGPSKVDATRLIGGTSPEKPHAAPNLSAKLAGKRFLVVEDEPLVALDLVAGLHKWGGEAVGPVGTSEQALPIIEKERIDGALLDGNLRGLPVDGIAAALTRRGVPFVFVTGYNRSSLPEAFAKAPILSKPFSEAQLLEAAANLLDRRAATPRLRN
jgi:PAS domain S-box-containing protein